MQYETGNKQERKDYWFQNKKHLVWTGAAAKKKKVRERRQLGFVTFNENLAVSRWVGLAYDR